jgi:hypothetical protein
MVNPILDLWAKNTSLGASSLGGAAGKDSASPKISMISAVVV